MTKRSVSAFIFNRSTSKFNKATMPVKKATKHSEQMLVYGSQIYDATVLMLICKVHRRVLLKECKNNCYYLPFYPLNLSYSWKTQIRHCLGILQKAIGVSNKSAIEVTKAHYHLHQLNQFRHPRYAEYLHQLVILVELKSCPVKCNHNDSSTLYKWYHLDLVRANHPQIWGPDPSIYLARQAPAPDTLFGSRCHELSIQSEFKNNLSKQRLAMAQSIKYSEHDLIGLYNDFIQHCYPSQYMNQCMFEDYLAKMEIKLDVNSEEPGDKKLRLFSAFCIDMPYIRFRDLVLGMVALDHRCTHGGIGGELRTRCIFRYFTKHCSFSMSFNELMTLLAASKKEVLNLRQAAESIFSKLALNKEKDDISMDDFTQMVGQLEIRGTAGLFRAIQNPLEQIRGRKAYQPLCAREVSIDVVLGNKPLSQGRQFYCLRCCDQKYTLALHSFSYNVANSEIVPFQEQPADRLAKVSRIVREQSQEATNPKNKFSFLREILRRFLFERQGWPMVSTQSIQPNWMKKTDRMGLVERIIAVCNESKDAFLNGPRVIRLSAPVYVFGDIHGNLKDLLIFEHLFWRMAPIGFVPNTLFLGDYVDRGNDSVECAIYLLCLKLLLPERFHLLRGNHEIRTVQKAFTTYRECLEKFGPAGKDVWESLNLAFDCLPLCAVVDEQIFAAHGGIPASSPRLETFDTINVPLINPNEGTNNKIAWEVLWNDPITQTDFKDFQEALEKGHPTLFPKNPHGFVYNTKRGTAYFYNCEALDCFLARNGLKFLLRAHEAMPNGFQFLMDGRMMTLFSNSHYCGSTNEAAVVYIDEHDKMRVIKIETIKKFGRFNDQSRSIKWPLSVSQTKKPRQ